MRLLVAEDHPTLARSIAGGLRDEGYAVDLTFDGEEALHMASVNPYNGIVLDIMLPQRDGFSIIQALRRKGTKTPVLCLTARDAVEDRVKGLDVGADDYLVKPFAFEELHCARPRNRSPRASAKLQHDRGRRSGSRYGQEMRPSRRKEYRPQRPRVFAAGISGTSTGSGRFAHANLGTPVRRA